MAILLGAFTIHGLVPGPRLLTEHLDITYSIVWSIALANVLGAGLCLAFSNQLARVASVRIGTLLPLVLGIIFIGAFQGSRQWGDLYILMGFGALGWVMKRAGWPRAPMILGFVLGGIIERYLFISIGRYDWNWLTQPLVILFFALAILSLAGPIIRRFKATGVRAALTFGPPRFAPAMLMSIIVAGVLISAITVSAEWPFDARIVPHVVAYTALICIVASLGFEIFTARSPLAKPTDQRDTPTSGPVLEPRERARRSGVFFLWCCGYLLLAVGIGMLPALFVFVLLCMRFWGRESTVRSTILAVCISAFAWVLFDRFLAVPWPQSLIGSWFPALQAYLP